MTQQPRGRIDVLADTAAGSSPVSPTSRSALFAGSSQDQANERAIPEGDRRENGTCKTCGGDGLRVPESTREAVDKRTPYYGPGAKSIPCFCREVPDGA